MIENISFLQEIEQVRKHACMCAQLLSRVQLFATSWTVAHQAPLSMGFSKQEDWNGLSFLPSGAIPDPGIESMSPALAGGFFYH